MGGAEKHYLNLLKENEAKMSQRRFSSTSVSSGGTYESADDGETVYLDDPEIESRSDPEIQSRSSIKLYDTYIKGFLILGFLVSIVVSFYTLLGSEASSPSRIYTSVLSLVFLGLYFLYSFAENRSRANIAKLISDIKQGARMGLLEGINIEKISEGLRKKVRRHLKWFGEVPGEAAHYIK